MQRGQLKKDRRWSRDGYPPTPGRGEGGLRPVGRYAVAYAAGALARNADVGLVRLRGHRPPQTCSRVVTDVRAWRGDQQRSAGPLEQGDWSAGRQVDAAEESLELGTP
jgi:hypothetical protein